MFGTKENKEVSFELSEDLLQLMHKLECYEDVKRVFTVLKNKTDICKTPICTSLESAEYGISKGSYMSAILAMYKEIILKEINDTN